MDKPKLLIVDDVEDIRIQMKWALTEDYDVYEAEDRPSAMLLFKEHRMPLVTLDLGLPPEANGVEEGFLVLDEILAQRSNTKIVVITGQGQREHALRAIGLGAYDYFNKPIQIDELNVVLGRAVYVHELERELNQMKSPGTRPSASKRNRSQSSACALKTAFTARVPVTSRAARATMPRANAIEPGRKRSRHTKTSPKAAMTPAAT